MLNRKDKIHAAVFLALGLMSISVASILIKICAAPPLIISAYRLGIAAVFYTSAMKIQRLKIWHTLTKKQRYLAVGSGLFLSLHFITWITSLRFTSVASSVVLVQTAPIFVALGSYLLIHEKPTPVSISGVIIALAGSVIIALNDFSGTLSSLKGNLFALLGAVGAAGYFIIGRKLRTHVSTLHYVSAVYSIAAITTFLITLGAGHSMFNYDGNTFLLFFAIALFPQIIGHTSLNWALRHFTATTVSVIALAEPIGASILAFFFLHESLTFVKIFGGLIVLCGVVLTLIGEKK